MYILFSADLRPYYKFTTTFRDVSTLGLPFSQDLITSPGFAVVVAKVMQNRIKRHIGVL